LSNQASAHNAPALVELPHPANKIKRDKPAHCPVNKPKSINSGQHSIFNTDWPMERQTKVMTGCTKKALQPLCDLYVNILAYCCVYHPTNGSHLTAL